MRLHNGALSIRARRNLSALAFVALAALGVGGAVLNSDTKVLVLQPGGNDARKGANPGDAQVNVASIKAAAAGRHIKVVMASNQMLRVLPHQDDEIHLTPDGYHTLAMELAPQVASGLRH